MIVCSRKKLLLCLLCAPILIDVVKLIIELFIEEIFCIIGIQQIVKTIPKVIIEVHSHVFKKLIDDCLLLFLVFRNVISHDCSPPSVCRCTLAAHLSIV